MILLEDKRSEIVKVRDQLIQDGFIRFSSDRLEVCIELLALASRYGAENVERFSRLLNKILFYFDHTLGYSVEQSYAISGTGYIVLTVLRKRKQKGREIVEKEKHFQGRFHYQGSRQGNRFDYRSY